MATRVCAYDRAGHGWSDLGPGSRDATRQGVDAMKSAWSSPGAMPPEARQAMADACKAATDGIKQAGAAMGCTL